MPDNFWSTFLKWTIITWVCGLPSFFLGIMATGKVFPIFVGMMTLILVFTLVDLVPLYRRERERNYFLRRSVALGIYIRCFWTILVLLSPGLAGAMRKPSDYSSTIDYSSQNSLSKIMDHLSWFFAFPGGLEVWVGKKMIQITELFFSINISKETWPPDTSFAYHYAVYFTTVTTGIVHAVMLTFLCAVIYFAFKGHAFKEVLTK